MKRVFYLTLPVAAGLLLAYRFTSPSVDTALRGPSPLPVKSAPQVAEQRSEISRTPLVDKKETRGELHPRKSSARIEPTAQQRHVLDEARKDDEDWEKQREKFLDGELKLSESEQVALEKARQSAASREAQLMARPALAPEEEDALAQDLRENRSTYDTQVQKLLGQQRYTALLSFYQDRWRSDGMGTHAPLK